MTAPVLAHKKFYIIKPAEGTNQIKNPQFSPPDYDHDWAPFGVGVTLEETGDHQRRGAYSMQVNTATGVMSGAQHTGLSVVSGLDYTFSCDVKGVAGQSMVIGITDNTGTVKASTPFTATGYWQRVEVSHLAAETVATYHAYISRNAVASTDPFYVDGAQFEQASAATTFIEGYMPGCRWEGYARNSASIRSAQYGLGGEIVDLEDYCHVVQVTGLGHGDWNQILTKMTSGGDMYQTHIRKSRQFSIIVDFIGNSLREIESNRAAVIDLLRPDRLRGQEMIVRYQGVDVNGVEATNPIDIVCVPLPATLTDTPDLPTYQRAVLNFSIPSGLLNGAYNEGAELDLYADFPAEYIVKRDPNGNWCKWNGSQYESLITGLNGIIYSIVEGNDGTIYAGGLFTNAGGDTNADFLAKWNGTAWSAVGSGLGAGASVVHAMAIDANGDLYVAGQFTSGGGVSGADHLVKITAPSSTATYSALGSGIGDASARVSSVDISSDGDIYIGGRFDKINGNNNCRNIAYYDVSASAWVALGAGLGGTFGSNQNVSTLKFAPNGVLYAGGTFVSTTNAPQSYLAKWSGTAWSAVSSNSDLNERVRVINFNQSGELLIGGDFTNAGGIAAADYIASWNGSGWKSLGTSVNNNVNRIVTLSDGSILVGGTFTTAGGITLADRVVLWKNGTWQPLDIDLPGTASVYSTLPASDGSLYIGGYYSTTVAGENAECGIVSVGVASASANTYPYIQVIGPGTLKAITNYTTGKSVMFDGLTLQAGEHINLYFDPLNLIFKGGWSGRGNLMRYVIPGSDYGDFYLKPGRNALSLYMTESTTDSGASITWTPLFWGIDGALL